MELVASRDRRAQQELIERLFARVRRATRSLLRNRADADDATQLCLMELLRSADNFRGEGSLEAWSDRIVVRTTLRFAKQRNRGQEKLSHDADPDALASKARPADEAATYRIPRSVEEYLDRLSPPKRTALVLRHVLGHSVAEIAELTNVSPNTVKDRLLTARREFRRMIRRDHVIAPASDRRTA